MQTIFYSWQSDLPNNKNRGFIEKCIEVAIKEINNDNLSLEIAIDRDTKGISGTPDIASSIFNKIDKTSIFIADISFINPTSSNRKCPNPNVLIELGYAAKAHGWNKIICIFNTEFGEIEELPFDLRFRRPITYKIAQTNNKTVERKALTAIIKKEISSIINEENENDDLNMYVKQQIDKEVVRVCNHLNKMIFGFGQLKKNEINNLLKLTKEDLEHDLFERKLIGFTVMKDWHDYIEKLEQIMNQPFFIQHSKSNNNNAIIRIIKSLTTLTVLQKQREVFIDTSKEIVGYRVIDARQMNEDNPKDSFILLEEIDSEKGKIVDSGKIQKYNLKKASNYQKISTEHFEFYIESILNLIDSIKNYLDKTGNEFILDPLHFRV